MANIPSVSVSELLDAGTHFGHKASRWNPKMEPYIYGTRDDIHIIDLQQTLPLLNIALTKIYDTVRNNGKVLFVGSKVQASELIAEYAEKCGQFYVNHRWLGGMLTNWVTISKSIKKLDKIEKTLEDPELNLSYTKKEILDLTRKKDRLMRSFSGIRKIGGKPDLIVIIDSNKEHLAISEARCLNIPIAAIVDTNSNPEDIDFPIPGNDDAIRSIKLYCKLFADAALAGIEDALTDSGVDVGASAEGLEEDGSQGKIKKLEKTAKVSKAKIVEAKEDKAPAAKDSKKAATTKPQAKSPAKSKAEETKSEDASADKKEAKAPAKAAAKATEAKASAKTAEKKAKAEEKKDSK